MGRFALYGDGRSDVVPAGKLADGKNVAIAKWKILGKVSGKRAGNAYVLMVSQIFLGMAERIANEIGTLRERAAFESTSQTEKILDAEIRGQQVAAGLGDFAFDKDAWRVHLRWIAVHDNAVPRLKNDVVEGIASQRIAKIDAQDFQRTVRRVSNQLRGVQIGVGGYITREIDGITQVSFSRGAIGSRMPHFAANPDAWRFFKLVATENAHGIERLKRRRGCRISQSRREAETLHARPEVRSIQADDLGIPASPLGHAIRSQRNSVPHLHPHLQAITAAPPSPSLH